jgi:hypothetical protein
MNGLNQMDYGARRRFSWNPSWTSVDPLAEKYYNVSPYVYCLSSPVNRIDPDGMQCPFFGFSTPLLGGIDPIIMSNKPVITETTSKVVKTTSEVGTKTVETTRSGRAINVERLNAGKQAETEQLQKLDLTKNTESFTKVDPKTGKKVTTIPDSYKNGQTTEIKNLGEGQKQSLTEQLRAQKELSNDNGTNPRLHINKEASLTKPLQNAGFDITRYIIVPPTQSSGAQYHTQKPIWQLY